jgi:arginyl-tRNA synthetase
MSTRGGSAVWLDDLLDDAVRRAKVEVRAHWPDIPESEVDTIAEAIGTGAVRFQVVRVAPEKPVAFRWEEALSFEGRSGPFLQYSYARAASILRKAGGHGPFTDFDPARLSSDDERAVIQVLARFPRTVQDVARTAHVHAIAGYAHDLADAFNRFYHSVPVLNSVEERASRLALVNAVHQTLGNALDLLGIARLERM